jgi:hypothetical protein
MHKCLLERRRLLLGALVCVGDLEAANDGPVSFKCNVQTIPIFLPSNLYPGFAISKWSVTTVSTTTVAVALKNLTPIATDPMFGKNVFVRLRAVVRVSPASLRFVFVKEMPPSLCASPTAEKQNALALHTAVTRLVCWVALQHVHGPHPCTRNQNLGIEWHCVVRVLTGKRVQNFQNSLFAMQLGGKDASQFVTQTVLDTAQPSSQCPHKGGEAGPVHRGKHGKWYCPRTGWKYLMVPPGVVSLSLKLRWNNFW